MSNKKCENSAGVVKNRCVIQNILHMVKDPCPAFLTYHLVMNCIVSPLVLTLFFRNICEVWYESIASFFSDNNFNRNEIYICLGRILYGVEIIFPQNLLHFQHTFLTFA